jgi:hypothetical protein
MTAPREIPDPPLRPRGPMFWLAPGGFGNGISLWVDSMRCHSAENLLMELLAVLHGRRPPRESTPTDR